MTRSAGARAGAAPSPWLIAAASALLLSLACRTAKDQPAPPSPERLSSLATTAGLVVPPSARLVFEDLTSPRAGSDDAGLWIVVVGDHQRPVALPGVQVTVPASTVRAAIAPHVPDLALGNDTGHGATVNDWTRGTDRWRCATLTTDRALFLLLERSKL